MTDVVISWLEPSPSQRQRPVDHIRVEGRIAAEVPLPFTVLNTVDAALTSLTIQDAAPGAWEFRGFAVDADGRESEPATATVAVEFDAPSVLVSFGAVAV